MAALRGSPQGSEVNVRRARLIVPFVAIAAMLSGGLILTAPTARADSVNPEIAYEGWYFRAKTEDPQVDPPACPPESVTLPVGCGPVAPDLPAPPQAKSTGHYVVSSAGGRAGDDDGEGDTGWAAFQWDLFEYTGVTVDKFVVTLHLGVDNNGHNNGDTYTGTESTVPPVQACNALEGWSSEPGANPWKTRPKASTECVAAKVEGKKFTFDVTTFAQSWVDGKGFGFVVRPGTPEETEELPPFQITLSGYYDTPTSNAACNRPETQSQCRTTTPVPPVVAFEYTVPEDEEDVFEEIDEDLGGDDELFEDITDVGDDDFGAEPDLDIIPTDVGSDPLPEDVPADGEEAAAPTDRGPRRPISSETGFPWVILLLLPIAAIAFWSTGTALGPIGDPVPARQGGVGRVLAERHAANGGNDFTRN